MKNRLSFLLTALSVLVILLAGCGRDAETVKRRYLANGEKYLAQGKIKEATIMFRNAIKRDPKFGEAYDRLGDAELKRGEAMAALSAYRRAVELLPAGRKEDTAGKLADIYLLAYISAGKKSDALLSEAEQLSNQLLKSNANSYHGLRLKGLVAVARGQFPEALVTLRRADQVRPKQADVLFAIAQILNQTNNWPEAESVALQIVKDTPSHGLVYDFLVGEYMRRNQPALAEKIMSERVANNPKIVEYRLYQAAFFLAANRKSEADKVVADLMAKESEDKTIRSKVGDFFVRTRQYDRALEVYKVGAEKYSDIKTPYRLKTAQVFLVQGKPKDALAAVEKALADDPKSNDALSMRASLQLQYGGKEQQQSAINDLQALIGRDSKNVVVRYNLARAYFSRGELDAARVQYNEAIKLQPSFLAAYLGSAQVALSQRDWNRAIQDAEAVLKVDARSVPARLMKTNAEIQMGNLRQARADLMEYAKDGTNSPDLEFQLALTDFSEGKFKDAEVRFRALREKFPTEVRLVFAVAEVMARTGRTGEALNFLKAEKAKNPGNRALSIAIATAAINSNNLAVAEEEYSALLAAEPKNLEMYMRMGDLYRRKGQLQPAIDILQKGQQLAPTNPGANLQLALTLEAAGRKQEALPLYESVVKVDPENAIALNNLAFQYAELGKDLDMAMKFAQKAKQKAPNSDDISDTLGWVYVKKQLNDEAISIYRDLLKRSPKNPLYHFHLGYAFYQKGNKQDAKQALQTALSLKPAKDDEVQIRQLIGKVG